MTLLDFEARFWIALYVTGQIGLGDFRRWLLPAAWGLSEPGIGPDSPLVRLAELRMAEYMNGHWTQDDLRRMFAQIAPMTTGFPVQTRVQAPVSTETVHTVRGTSGLQNALATA